MSSVVVVMANYRLRETSNCCCCCCVIDVDVIQVRLHAKKQAFFFVSSFIDENFFHVCLFRLIFVVVVVECDQSIGG